MESYREAAARLAAIDALQDDLLERLDELERRTAAVLAECQPPLARTTPATELLRSENHQLRQTRAAA